MQYIHEYGHWGVLDATGQIPQAGILRIINSKRFNTWVLRKMSMISISFYHRFPDATPYAYYIISPDGRLVPSNHILTPRTISPPQLPLYLRILVKINSIFEPARRTLKHLPAPSCGCN